MPPGAKIRGNVRILGETMVNPLTRPERRAGPEASRDDRFCARRFTRDALSDPGSIPGASTIQLLRSFSRRVRALWNRVGRAAPCLHRSDPHRVSFYAAWPSRIGI